jgi:hypothetical protein
MAEFQGLLLGVAEDLSARRLVNRVAKQGAAEDERRSVLA